MPTYLYRCPECGKILEREFPLGKQPKVVVSYCEKKGKDAECRREWHGVDFIMKGE